MRVIKLYPSINNIIKAKLQPIGAGLNIENKEKNIKAIIQINSTALEIFKLCDGKHSLEEIKLSLANMHNEKLEVASEFVDEFIQMSIQIGTIIGNDIATTEKTNLKVYGSKDYWSPSVVAIELTHKCPLLCKHCYVNAGKGDNMENVLLEKVCNEIIELKSDIVQLTGGEPLLHPKITEVVELLVENKIQVQIMTSGMINNNEINDTLILLKKVNGIVQVSLDGLEETHNSFRGRNDSFQNAIKFIKEIIKRGITINVATCLSNQPKEEIEELCKFVKEIGVSGFRLGTISESGRAKENNIYSSANRVCEMKSIKSELSQKYGDDKFNVLLIEENSELEKIKGCNNCGYGHNFIKVDPKGKLFPCLLSKVPIGDYYTTNITDLMKEKYNDFYKIVKPSKEICGDCESQEVCNNCINEGLIHGKHNKNCNWLNLQKDCLSKAYGSYFNTFSFF